MHTYTYLKASCTHTGALRPHTHILVSCSHITLVASGSHLKGPWPMPFLIAACRRPCIFPKKIVNMHTNSYQISVNISDAASCSRLLASQRRCWRPCHRRSPGPTPLMLRAAGGLSLCRAWRARPLLARKACCWCPTSYL